MAEWHVTPDYIVNNWTDEQLDLYVEKLIERKKREIPTVSTKTSGKRKVSIDELSRLSGGKIKVVKK